MQFPARTPLCQNPRWLHRSLRSVAWPCSSWSVAADKTCALLSVCQEPCVLLSWYIGCGRARVRLVRSSLRDSTMEGSCNSELLDGIEPAQKKQAREDCHVNGHSNGSSAMPVDKSLALRVKKLAPEAILPSRGSALAAGYDLSSAYDDIVPAHGKALIKTELSVAIPEGTYARVAPRSGLAWKHSIDVGAGVIDADYRGPLGVILFNHSSTDFSVKAGDRIAQLILEVIVTPDVVEVADLDPTARGEGGFGSTGVAVAPVVVVEAPPCSS